MAGKDHADLVAETGEGLMKGNAGPSRVGENGVNPVVDQALNDDVSPAGELRCAGFASLGRL
jgi:hypothetical protein